MTMLKHLIDRRMLGLFMAVLLMASLIPVTTSHAQGYTGKVICNADDVHTTPDIYAPVLATFYENQTVTLVSALDTNSGWTPVMLSSGQYGWMKTACLSSTTTAATTTNGQGGYYAGAKTATVATGALHVRSGAGWWFPSMASYYRGTVLSLTGYRNADATWVQVYLPDGRQGWLNAYYAYLSVPASSLAVAGASSGYQPGYGTATVATGALNVRASASPYATVLATYYRDTVLGLAGARNADATWVKVVLPDGRQGWVNTSLVTLSISIWTLPVEGTVYVPPTTPPATPPTSYYTHVVAAGENLFRISLRYGVNMYTLAQINGIADVSRIYAGQVLYIPS